MLSDELASLLGRDTVKRLLKMDRVAGRLFLAAYHSGLSSEQIDEALSLCAETVSIIHVPRNKFYAVAWLTGASWGQIADLCCVARATVQSAVRQLLPSDQRRKLRLRESLSLEQVSLVKAEYENILNNNAQHVKDSSALSIARVIATLVEEESDKL